MSNGVNFKDLCIDLRGQLDRVTAERDAALGRVTELESSFDELAASVGFSEARLDQAGDSPIDCANQLQQRLTAADEREDVLEGHHFELKETVQQLIGNAVDGEDSGEMVVPRADIDELRPLIAALKPADGADYRKSCEAVHKAMSMENQIIVAPGQFKCLACGDIHPGSGNMPCPKMSPTTQPNSPPTAGTCWHWND